MAMGWGGSGRLRLALPYLSSSGLAFGAAGAVVLGVPEGALPAGTLRMRWDGFQRRCIRRSGVGAGPVPSWLSEVRRGNGRWTVMGR